jgi:hypothetical protein
MALTEHSGRRIIESGVFLMDGVDGPMEGLSFDPFENDNLGRQEVLAAAKKAAK